MPCGELRDVHMASLFSKVSVDREEWWWEEAAAAAAWF